MRILCALHEVMSPQVTDKVPILGSGWRMQRSRIPARYADAFNQRGKWADDFADIHSVCAHLNGQRALADHVQPYFSAVALPQNTRYMSTVYAMITGSVIATPTKITFSDAVLMAASHTVMRPITMSGKML